MQKKAHIKVCTGHACKGRMSEYTLERAKSEIKKTGKDITVERGCCQGRCAKGPNIVIERNGKQEIKHNVSPVEMGKIIKQT